jgi:hypothetical protein
MYRFKLSYITIFLFIWGSLAYQFPLSSAQNAGNSTMSEIPEAAQCPKSIDASGNPVDGRARYFERL